MTDRSKESLPGFNRLLARAIERRDISIEELAYRSGVEPGRIERFLRADAEPSATELLRLAGALDVRPQELLEGIEWVPDGQGGGEYRAPGGESSSQI